MVEIHLYGELRRYAERPRPDGPTFVGVTVSEAVTVRGALVRLGIPAEEVGQVFLNHQLLNTTFSMAPWLGYVTAKERRPENGDYLETPLRSGDRVGVFPHNMSILVV